MSLSEELRDELAAIAPRRLCDRLAELSALFHTAGTLHVRGRGEVAVHLDVGANAVARRAFSLLREFGVHAEIRTYRQHAFERATRYQVHVAGGARALQTLNEAGVVTSALAPVQRPPARVVARACCRGAYLRGALLGAGSLSGPGSPHLEIRTAAREGAEFLAELAVEEGLELNVVDRARPLGRLRQGRRHDRRSRRPRGRERDRARARRARGRGGDALAREPARERRPREPRPRRTRRAPPAPRRAPAPADRPARRPLTARSARSRSCGCATRPCRCASSARSAALRRRRPPRTGGC